MHTSVSVCTSAHMATSGGNSSGSTQVLNSGSEGDLVDQRKRKRMQSNRESARRSRQRKQNRVDELMAQAAQLRKENDQILTATNITTQHYLKFEAENSVLRAQMDELSQRLQSLQDILYYINTTTVATATTAAAATSIDGVFDIDNIYGTGTSLMNNPWDMGYANQHHQILASADQMLFQY